MSKPIENFKINLKKKLNYNLNYDEVENNLDNLFTFFNQKLNDEHLLSKGEILISEKIENNFLEICEESKRNPRILDMNELLLANEIEILEAELEDLNDEIIKEEEIYKLESDKNEELKVIQNSLEENLKVNNILYEREIKIFESNFKNSLLDIINLISSNSQKIISEFDFNLKLMNNNDTFKIINNKKFGNNTFEEIINSLEVSIEYLEKQFSKISTKEEDNLISPFIETLSSLDKLIEMYLLFFIIEKKN